MYEKRVMIQFRRICVLFFLCVALWLGNQNQNEISDLRIQCNNKGDRLFPSPLIFGAVVRVETENGWGSGFAIGPDTFVTARHVIVGCQNVKIVTATGIEYQSLSIEESPDIDVALVRIREKVFFGLRIDCTGGYESGDGVYSISTPKSFDNYNILTFGTISGRDRQSKLRPYWPCFFIIDMSLWHGSSGCPVFNKEGKVIGIFVGGYMPTINYCIPMSEIIKWDRMRNAVPIP